MLPQITTAKTAFEPAGTTTVWHSHDVLQTGIMRTGAVRIDFPQASVEVERDGFFAIAPRHLHRITDITDIEMHAVFAELTAEPRNWNPRVVGVADLAVYAQTSIVAPDAGALSTVAAALIRHYSTDTAESSLVADGLLLQLLVEARCLPHRTINLDENPGRALTYPSQLLEAIRLIERSYHDPDTTVASLAEHMHVCRSTLFRLFRRHMGYGPDAFLRHYRLDRARELLQRHDARINEIAYSVGFRDPATFCRAVRRYAGVTPSQLREKLIREAGVTSVGVGGL